MPTHNRPIHWVPSLSAVTQYIEDTKEQPFDIFALFDRFFGGLVSDGVLMRDSTPDGYGCRKVTYSNPRNPGTKAVITDAVCACDFNIEFYRKGERTHDVTFDVDDDNATANARYWYGTLLQVATYLEIGMHTFAHPNFFYHATHVNQVLDFITKRVHYVIDQLGVGGADRFASLNQTSPVTGEKFMNIIYRDVTKDNEMCCSNVTVGDAKYTIPGRVLVRYVTDGGAVVESSPFTLPSDTHAWNEAGDRTIYLTDITLRILSHLVPVLSDEGIVFDEEHELWKEMVRIGEDVHALREFNQRFEPDTEELLAELLATISGRAL